MEYSNLFVCLMGICTVFIGLVCIIALVSAMSAVVRRTDRRISSKKHSAAPCAAPLSEGAPTPELVAAAATAIAEYSGTDASAIRIVSIRKI